MKKFILATSIAGIALSVSASAADIAVEGQFVSTVPTGTPPLEVSSVTKVQNLNADTVDGFDGTDFYTLAELATSGGAAVHFDNITNIPTDGVKEINQECAASGCFDGDFPGFPVQIFNGGSYRLTSNLDISGESNPENRSAIVVNASDVTIDLNGFTIAGPATCTGEPVTSCAPVGTGDGIQTGSSAIENLTVLNGSIRGMGDAGIVCASRCIVKGVRVIENGGNGVHVSNRSSLIRDVLAVRNGEEGIRGFGLIRNNVSEGNGTYGIFSQPGASVTGNVVTGNGGNGIRCFSCVLLDNVVTGNQGFGLQLAGGAAYGRNLVGNNDAGAITGSGVQVDKNVCGSSLCP